MDIVWKPILGYEKEYEINNLGFVKSLTRKVKCMGGVRTVNERILKPRVSPVGYYHVQLKHKGKYHSVHKLVLISFIGEKPNSSWVCNHKDGNKLNNTVENLEWVTRSENQIHAYKLGLQKRYAPLGEKNKNSKYVYAYSPNNELLFHCKGVAELARRLNIGVTNIHRVLSKKRKYYNNLYFTYEPIREVSR